MSTNGRGGGIAHSGFRTLTAGLLLAAAVWGLYNLESQIQVFGFGASGWVMRRELASEKTMLIECDRQYSQPVKSEEKLMSETRRRQGRV